MSWTGKYKKSIDCDNPQGFSQKAHCDARKKRQRGEVTKSKSPFSEQKEQQTFTKFTHKTKHLQKSQHRLDPNIDLKHLVHHSVKQYVDRDVDGDVDVYDNPNMKTPDENVLSAKKAQDYSSKLISKQKGELKHTRRGIAYEHNMNEEGLRDWFRKSKSKDGKPGWVNVVTGGTCASDKPGEGVPKCVSSSKRESMTKAERLSASKRKKAADPNQQEKTGAQKPTYVSTDKKNKKMEEEKKYPDHEHSMIRSELQTILKSVKRLKKKMKGEGNVEAWVQSKITKAADYIDSAADYIDSGEHNVHGSMDEQKDIKGKGSGKKDACYHKVKSRYDVWPSAYASGALVKCRKVGASNWGDTNENYQFSNWRDDFKSTEYEFIDLINPEPLLSEVVEEKKQKCWPGYEKKGSQKLFGKTYNRCVKKEEYEVPSKDLKKLVSKASNRIDADVDGDVDKDDPKEKGMGVFIPSSDGKKKIKPEIKSEDYYNWREELDEDWQKVNRQDRTDGLSQKAVDAYRRENPGSKLQTAVTEKKPTGKRAKRRKNFCSRVKGMKSKLTSAETARDPDSRINKALRRWNCN